MHKCEAPLNEYFLATIMTLSTVGALIGDKILENVPFYCI